jgi:hypothetical protein
MRPRSALARQGHSPERVGAPAFVGSPRGRGGIRRPRTEALCARQPAGGGWWIRGGRPGLVMNSARWWSRRQPDRVQSPSENRACRHAGRARAHASTGSRPPHPCRPTAARIGPGPTGLNSKDLTVASPEGIAAAPANGAQVRLPRQHDRRLPAGPAPGTDGFADRVRTTMLGSASARLQRAIRRHGCRCRNGGRLSAQPLRSPTAHGR